MQTDRYSDSISKVVTDVTGRAVITSVHTCPGLESFLNLEIKIRLYSVLLPLLHRRSPCVPPQDAVLEHAPRLLNDVSPTPFQCRSGQRGPLGSQSHALTASVDHEAASETNVSAGRFTL